MSPTSKRPSAPTEPMFRLPACTGTLQQESATASVSFGIQVDATGEVSIAIDPIPLGQEGMALYRSFADATARGALISYSLTGTGPDGESVACTELTMTSSQIVGVPDSPVVRIEATPGQVVLTQRTDEPASPHEPDLWEYWVDGLQCFPAVLAEFDFGQVRVQGVVRKGVRLGGRILVKPCTGLAEENIDAGADRILDVISMAAGQRLRWSVRQRRVRAAVETVIYPPEKAGPSMWACFSPLNLRPLLEAAALRYTPPLTAETGLDVAIQWSVAYSPHEEVRFLQKMTALEHLVHKAQQSAGLLPKADFRALRRSLEQVIADYAEKQGMSGGDPALSQIAGKLSYLNQATFKNNIAQLLVSLRVPQDGLENWQSLVDIRNNIVHTGIADPPERRRRSAVEADLLQAERFLRELLVRIFLSMLGYEGSYTSWHRGRRDRELGRQT